MVEQTERRQVPIVPPKRSPWKWLWVAVVVAIYWKSFADTDVRPLELFTGIPEMMDLFRRMQPNWDLFVAYLPQMWPHLMETFRIALLATTVGAVLTLPMNVLAARNITRNRWLYSVSKALLNLIRTLPDLLLAAIFVAALGIGPLAGIAALAIFSFGIIAKLTSETVEAIDPGPLEALTAVGANPIQLISYAVVPQVLPQFLAYTLYVFEINIRVAAVLGMVGAGGIGEWIMRDLNLFRYRHAAVIMIIILAFVVVIDIASTKIRERLV